MAELIEIGEQQGRVLMAIVAKAAAEEPAMNV